MRRSPGSAKEGKVKGIHSSTCGEGAHASRSCARWWNVSNAGDYIDEGKSDECLKKKNTQKARRTAIKATSKLASAA